MNWQIVTSLNDELRPWLWHDPDGVEILDDHSIRLTTRRRESADGRTAAGASVKLPGCQFGTFSFEAKMPRGKGLGSAAWLLNGHFELDIFEANTYRTGGYWCPILGHNVTLNMHDYIDKESLGLSRMKVRKPTDWQKFSATLLPSGFSIETEKAVYIYQDQHGFPYQGEYLDWYFTLWPQVKFVNSFVPGTLELRNIYYQPIVLS